MPTLKPGQTLVAQTLKDIHGRSVPIPDPTNYIHLQFRRFSGCPICNIHMGRLASRAQDLEAHKIKEVIVFYSEDKKIHDNLGGIPFVLVGDPKRVLYRQFGVEKSILSVLNPLAWPAATLGFIKNVTRILKILPSGDESLFGLPADFLINPQGLVVDAHYGKHAYDQWSYEDLISKVLAAKS